MTLLGFLCLEAMPQCTIMGAEDFGITDGILVLNCCLMLILCEAVVVIEELRMSLLNIINFYSQRL